MEQPNKWQQPISLAQAILTIIVTGVSLFSLMFAAHGRFITLENKQLEHDKSIGEVQSQLKADTEFKRTVSIQLERLATQAEWMASWVKSGGEKR